MSGLLHSLRSLFGTPAAEEKGPGRPRTRRRAREEQEEEEEDVGGDDDVFSAFGSEDGSRSDSGSQGQESHPDEGGGEESEGGGEEGEEGNDGPPLESHPPAEEESGLDPREARRRRRSRARRQRQRPTEETKEEEEGEAEGEEGEAPQGQSGSSSGGATLATQPTIAGTEPSEQEKETAAEEGDASAPSAAKQGQDAEISGDQDDAMAAFFSHLPPTGLPKGVPNEPPGAGEGPPVTPKGWKDARKAWLRGYLARRLVGADDDDDEEGEGEGGEGVDVEEGDACSFASEVLDEPFGGEMEADADRGQEEGQDVKEGEGMPHEHDEEEEEDGGRLQTQTMEAPPATPRAPSSVPRFSGAPDTADSASPLETQQQSQPQPEADAAMEEEGGSPAPPRTQQQPDGTQSPGLFGGIKRRLGFAPSPADTPHDDDEEAQQPPNKRARGASRRGRGRRGTMWDGRPRSIPHVADASGTCTRINEVDLHSGRVDLSLCRVVRVWESRSTRRMEGMHAADNAGAASDDATVPPNVAMMPFEHWEDDGPLNTIYKRVLTVEVVQLDDDAYDETGTAATTGTSPSVAHLARAAFSDGRHRLAWSTARRRRRDAKRMKIFLYNRWADAASLALKDLRSQSPVKKGPVPLLVAVKNLPAPCVLPRAMAPRECDPRLAQYVAHPFGDGELGTLSPYCICLGDKSTVKLGEGNERQPLHFDYGGVEVRFAEAPAGDTLAVSPGEELVKEEAVLTAVSVHGPEGYVWGGAGGRLGERYARIGARTAFAPRPEAMADDLDEDEPNGDGDAAPHSGVAEPGAAASAETACGADDGATGAAPTAPGEATAEPRADIVRPPSVVPLSHLLPRLERNGSKKLTLKRPVYGVVLGFSPPSLTRSMDWMMSVAMIDETLPLSNRPRQENGGEDAPKEMHVPSVTLVLFVKDKRRLPVIRAAGDVVCCERVVLQAWNGEPQLCARPFSKVVVVRPGRERRPGEGDGMNDAALSEEWATSSSCHDVDGGVHDNLDEGLARGLWVWGQRRLRWHPTMSPHCQLTISQIPSDGHGEGHGFEQSMSGDLTAAVTAIIPVPEHMRRRDTPRGYLRLWDGTGPSRSDPLPLGPTLTTDGSNPQQQPHVNDPPEQLLVTIEKIVEDMSSSGDSNEVRAPVALCGRVVNAIIWEENLWNLICGGENSIVDVGSFVRLRNVNSAKLHSSGVSCLSVHVKSSLTPLPFDTYEVRALLKGHDALVRRGVPTNPTSAILPARSNAGNSARRNDSVQEALRSNGLSNIQECLETQPPSLFTIQFEVSHTIPACDPTSIDAVEALYAKREDGSASLRFALHIKDASSEIDVLCLGQAAETMLGITTRDVVERNREKCEGALGTLKDILAPGSVCEGKVRSMVGKDGKLWFILKSMFCITADM